MDFFETVWNHVCAFLETYVIQPFADFHWLDAVDILLLAFALYEIYRFSRKRRAGRVLLGLTVVILIGVVVSLMELPALSYIARLFASAAFFCIVLIFQPEIRDALERIGNSRLVAPFGDTLPKKLLPAAREVARETVDAVFQMSESKTGALIVFEGLTRLGDYAETGKIVDAKVTSHLLQNIFYDKAPLHDGALIIRDMRIWRASCVLPSTQIRMDFGNMGTRHRAAVGITEVSDALVVVVSEQTGIVSVAQDGKLLRGVDKETLNDILLTYLAGARYLRYKKQAAKAAKAATVLAERTATSYDKASSVKNQNTREFEEEPDSDPAAKPAGERKAHTSRNSDGELL